MKRFLRIAAALVLALLLVSMLVSCSHIEDTNGPDDTSLAVLTEEEVMSWADHGTSFYSVTEVVNGKYSYKVGKLSGVETLESYNGKTTYMLKSSLTLNSGNLRAILFCDGVYLCDIPLGESEIPLSADAKKYKIRFAGESANFTFECEFFE